VHVLAFAAHDACEGELNASERRTALVAGLVTAHWCKRIPVYLARKGVRCTGTWIAAAASAAVR
jgi:hypothetical protein